jgi:hypothetical protein
VQHVFRSFFRKVISGVERLSRDRKNHHMYFVANSLLVSRYMRSVGTMSMKQTFRTAAG